MNLRNVFDCIQNVVIWTLLFGVGLGGWAIVFWSIYSLYRFLNHAG